MARLKVPYLVAKRRADGSARHYWQPSATLAAAGWRPLKLSDDETAAIGEAKAQNEALRLWRAGQGPGPGETPADRAVQAGTVAALIRAYTASPRFAKLKPKTAYDYRRCLAMIEAWAGPEPARRISRGMVQDFYEELQAGGRLAQANAVLRVAGVLFKYGLDRDLVAINPAERPGLTGTAPRLRVWSEAELAAVVAAADVLDLPSIGDAVLLAAWTAQREGDLLRARWGDLVDGRLRARQSKRGAQVAVRLAPPVVARLAAAKARLESFGVTPGGLTPLVLCEMTGRAWNAWTFSHRFAAVRAAAAADCPSLQAGEHGLGVTFQDLRDTGITRLASGGATIPEIAAVSGHSEKSVYGTLRHYLALGQDLADSAIDKAVQAWEREQAKNENGQKLDASN